MATSKGTDILDFLAQKANIGGCVLASSALLTSGFLALQPLPILGMAAASYFAGFLIFGQAKQSISIGQGENSSAVELATIQDNIQQLRVNIEQHRKDIAPEIMESSETIFTTLEEIMPRWKELNSFVEQKYTLNDIITKYFPEIITNYMNLPKSYYRNGAKSKVAGEIVAQLAILQTALEEIRDNLYKGVEKDIKVQGQFLKERFITSESSLRL